jgi:hypothetical protein
MCDSGRNDKKVRCVRETRPDYDDSGSSCTWRLSAIDIEDLFDGADVGEKVVLELCEMTEEELDALPEFEGW